MLFWDYESHEFAEAGALEPVSLQLPYSIQPSHSPFRTRDYPSIWRAIEAGYVVQPSDCPPVRAIGMYGYVVRCPGEVILRRAQSRHTERRFTEKWSAFGFAEIGGALWPKSDSLRVASWIAGSEFVKIQTGVRIYFPASMWLYQGPLPNQELLPRSYEVMAGMEYPARSRTKTRGREAYAHASMNVIVRLPHGTEDVVIGRGESICWLFPVQPRGAMALHRWTDDE